MRVGGETLTVDTVLYTCTSRFVTGPVQLTVTMPSGTRGRVLGHDGGFDGRGYVIVLNHGAGRGEKASVAVTVPARTPRCALEVGVAAASGYPLAAPGRVNTPTTLDVYV